MPRKGRATKAYLQNLQKANAKKNNNILINNYGKLLITPSRSQTSEALLPQMADLNTLDAGNIPTMPNEFDVIVDSKGSGVEIVDSGSDADICKEAELTKFSRMLCDAQKRALAEEKAGKKWKSYTGHSRATEYRRKRVQKDLAAQGYLPLHKVWKWVASKQNTKPAAKKLTTPQELASEESEEGPDNDKATTSQLQIHQPSISKDTDMEELVAAASEDRDATRDEHRQLAQIPMASKEHRRDVLGPAATDAHHRRIPGLVVSEGRCWDALGPAARDCHRDMFGPAVSDQCRDMLGPAARDRHRDTLGPAAMEGCHRIMQGLVASDECGRAMQGLPENEEESTGSDKGTGHEDSQNIVIKNGTHVI